MAAENKASLPADNKTATPATPVKSALTPETILKSAAKVGTEPAATVPTVTPDVISKALGRFNTMTPEEQSSIVGKNAAQVRDMADTAPAAISPSLHAVADFMNPKPVMNRVGSAAREDMTGQLKNALDEIGNLPERRGRAKALVKTVLGKDFPVSFEHVAPGTAGHTDLGDIAIGMHILDPERVATHEIAHVVAERALSNSDRKLVRMSLEDGSSRYKELQKWASKQNNGDKILSEIADKKFERIAYYFEAKQMGDLKPSGLFGRIMDKMSGYVERVGNAFKGHGFRNIDDLVDATYNSHVPVRLRGINDRGTFNRVDDSAEAEVKRRESQLYANRQMQEDADNQPGASVPRVLGDKTGATYSNFKSAYATALNSPQFAKLHNAVSDIHTDSMNHMAQAYKHIQGVDIHSADTKAAEKVIGDMNMARVSAPNNPEGDDMLRRLGLSDKGIHAYRSIRSAANSGIDFEVKAAREEANHYQDLGRQVINKARTELEDTLGMKLGNDKLAGEQWFSSANEEIKSIRSEIGKQIDDLSKTPASKKLYSAQLDALHNKLDKVDESYGAMNQSARDVRTMERTYERVQAHGERLKDEGYIPSQSAGKYHIKIDGPQFSKAINTDDLKAGMDWANAQKDDAIAKGASANDIKVSSALTDNLPDSQKARMGDIYSKMRKLSETHASLPQRAAMLHTMLEGSSVMNGNFLTRLDSLLPDKDVMGALHAHITRTANLLAHRAHAGEVFRSYHDMDSNPKLQQYAKEYLNYQDHSTSKFASMARQVTADLKISPLRVMMYNLMQNLPLAKAHLMLNGSSNMTKALSDVLGHNSEAITNAADKGLPLKGLTSTEIKSLAELERDGTNGAAGTSFLYGYGNSTRSNMARLRNFIFKPAATSESYLRRATALAAMRQGAEKFKAGQAVTSLYKDASGARQLIQPTGDSAIDNKALLDHARSVVKSSMQTYNKADLRPIYKHTEAQLVSQFSDPTMQAISRTLSLVKSNPAIGVPLLGYFAAMGGLAGVPLAGVAKTIGDAGVAMYNQVAPQYGGATTPYGMQHYQNELSDHVGNALSELGGGKFGSKEFWTDAANSGILNALTGEDFGAFSSLGNVGNLGGIDLQNSIGGAQLAELGEGPYASVPGDLLGFSKDLATGNWQKAIHDIPSSVLKRLALSAQGLATGEAQTGQGQTISKISPLQSALYAFGIDPANVSKYYNEQRPDVAFAQASKDLEQKQLSGLAQRSMSGAPGSSGALDTAIKSMINWNDENASRFGKVEAMPNMRNAALHYVMPLDNPVEQYLLYHNLYGVI